MPSDIAGFCLALLAAHWEDGDMDICLLYLPVTGIQHTSSGAVGPLSGIKQDTSRLILAAVRLRFCDTVIYGTGSQISGQVISPYPTETSEDTRMKRGTQKERKKKERLMAENRRDRHVSTSSAVETEHPNISITNAVQR